MKQYLYTPFVRLHGSLSWMFILMLVTTSASAVNRVSATNGNFTNPNTWNPAGTPSVSDNITILASHNVNIDNNCSSGSVTINQGGSLTWVQGKTLEISGNFIVNGSAAIIEGNINLATPAIFRIGPAGSVIWQPENNTVSGATLFTNGNEDFHPTSTLQINRWYNYMTVPIGSVVTGNFGNLQITTLSNGLLYEWNQNNEFEKHKILGTLTIDQGWVVLDKSGKINATEIGNIHLKNINSYLDIHSGTHPGSFKLVTGSIQNTGGTLNGIYNGDGNISVEVRGDFTNLGNTELIFNSGIQGLGNGNASMNVLGKFRQSAGDFRGIFNISSSSAGKADLEFGELEVTGGVFMAHYACHTQSMLSTLKVNGNATISFTNSNGKFRANGLTTLSGTNSDIQLEMIVDGNLHVKGNAGAEFTSSGSSGQEWFEVKGEVIFEGCTSNFNYGAHNTLLTFHKNLTVNGGIVFLSRTDGMLSAEIKKDLNLDSGTFSVKAGTGNSNLSVLGNYNQQSGSVFFHNNITEPTWNIIYVTVYGNYLQSGGSVMFDNNSASAAGHILSLNGSTFSIAGNATLTSSAAAFNPVYGHIYYDRYGELEYNNTGNGTIIQNMKQTVSSGCNLKIVNGHLQAASTPVAVNDMIKVNPDGILDLGEQQVYSNAINPFSSITVMHNGRLRTSHSGGLYNGTTSAAIRATGNISYKLSEESIVEYYGLNQQDITGTGLGTAQGVDQQYGILEINKTGSQAKLNSAWVTARRGLSLVAGELYLNNYNITIESGFASAIFNGSGYIKSEPGTTLNKGMVIWKNIEGGSHTIPFGISNTELLPLTFTPLSGLGNTFSASTRTCAPDNRPLPAGITNININGKEAGNDRAIDRWYQLSANGMVCNITLPYSGKENSLEADIAVKNFSPMVWSAGKWLITDGEGTGVTTGTGYVNVRNAQLWGSYLLVSNEKPAAADLLSFEAKLNHNQVDLKWITVQNNSARKYTVQRSTDGYNFTDYMDKPAIIPVLTGQTYREIDNEPLEGVSWYRIRQQNQNGLYKYSNAEKIEYTKGTSASLEIISVSPNPFKSGFEIKFDMPADGLAKVRLTSANGQEVYETEIKTYRGINTHQITGMEKLVPGMYILSVKEGKSLKNYKLFKI